jgi:hypothetical protein
MLINYCSSPDRTHEKSLLQSLQQNMQISSKSSALKPRHQLLEASELSPTDIATFFPLFLYTVLLL